MARVVLFGTSRLGQIMRFYLEHDSPHEVVAFAVDRSHLGPDTCDGLPVVAFDEVEARYPPGEHRMLISVGVTRVNHLRAERYRDAKAMGYQLLTYVSSKATVWHDLTIGDNSVVMEGSVIQPFVAIGNDVTLGPGSFIGHHTTIGDHCFLGSRADVSGDVTIEPYSFLGANSTIRDGVTIAAECVIGANVAILHSTREREVYVQPRAVLLPLPSHKLPRI